MQLSAETPTVVRANAGTGKTFQLSNRYLLLLALGCMPEQILATTFTRKAAGEIQSRIFIRIAKAALSEEAATALGKELGIEPFPQTRAQEILNTLVQSQHRLGLYTLDGFYTRLLRMFGFEMGFANGAKIASSEVVAAMRSAAIQKLFASHDSQALYALLRFAAGNQDKYSIHRRVDSMVQRLHEVFLESARSHWSTLEYSPLLESAELEAAAAALDGVSPVLTKAGTADKRFVTALTNTKKYMERGDWESLFTKGISSAVAQGTPKFSGVNIPDQYVSLYRPLVEHARSTVLAELKYKNLATFELLEHFNEAFSAEIFDRAALGFGTIKMLLSSVSDSTAFHELYFRLDSTYKHLLLDEFQDTSLAEWNLLRPVASEILSQAGLESTFFCVGDVKQAIYGWRGGKAEIFDTITDEWNHIKSETLGKSYRSSSEVVNFVNHVFLSIEQNSALSEYAATAAVWSKGFAEHSTERTSLPGFISFENIPLPEDPELSLHTVLAMRAAEVVADIRKENPSVSIGVLVPRNADIGVMMKVFAKEEFAVDASEEGGSPITDSRAVLAVLAICTFIDHPNDSIARFHAASSPFGAVIGLTDSSDAGRAFEVAMTQRDALATGGFGAFILKLFSATKQHLDAHEHRRLLQLVELGFAFDPRRTARALDFVQFVTLEKIQNARPSAVRVMTYHRSKGLEFDAVVLPFLDKSWTSKANSVLSLRESPLAPPSHVSLSVPKELQSLHPLLEQLSRRDKENRVFESLNVLYVALTRARHAIYGFLPEPKVSGKKSDDIPKAPQPSSAGVLRASLPGLGQNAVSLFTSGTSTWASLVPAREIVLTQPALLPAHVAFGRAQIAAPRLDIMAFDAASEIIQQCQPLFDAAASAAIDGEVLCDILRSCDWIENGQPDAKLLLRLFARHRIALDQQPAYEAVLREVLSNDSVRTWFDKERSLPKEASFYRGLEFSHATGETNIKGRLDRVVVFKTKNVATAAAITLFSSNAIPEQMLSKVRETAGALFSISPACVTLQMLDLKTNTVVTL